MGNYLNPGSGRFYESLRSQIYIDKTGLIERTNEKIRTAQKYICLSRPRRFGKSMAMDMLAAYYDRTEDTSDMFNGLKISQTSSYREHLNRYDIIKINMQDFLSMTHSMDEMLAMLQRRILSDLRNEYPEYVKEPQLVFAMEDIYARTGRPFINTDKPAAILELKWDKSAEGVIAQIKNRHYVDALKDYRGNLLLAGINYDKTSRKHTCVIERVEVCGETVQA